jgi:2-oxoglutarate ferredoxin oxidoreductase subunit alpha
MREACKLLNVHSNTLRRWSDKGIIDSYRIGLAINEDEELILLKHSLPSFEAGEQLHSRSSIPPLHLPPPADASPRVILSGNSATARAALRAGIQAFFGYPITPASEIMKEVYQDLIYDHGVFLQAEDEIAAAGLTIGASITGAKSLTATSGPGFDLMTEMMGLATASETPMVIVDVQRGGPSTGIPSGTEQSDLDHAIYGGHGDAPRTVLAPFDIEGCYRLTIESLNIAERHQCVVILLSDQWLAQTLVATSDTFLRDDPVIWNRKKPRPEDAADYLRYKLTDDFVSPMANVGDEGFSYRTSGLSHDEKGRPAFDSEVNQTMHDKRWRKLAPLTERDEMVRLFGNESSSRGVIAWGSTARAVLETIKDMGLSDKVKLAVPELVFPLPHAVRRFVESTEKLLVVEMNHSGQFYHYLRSRVDLPKDTRLVARAGSRPFSRQELGGPMLELAE